METGANQGRFDEEPGDWFRLGPDGKFVPASDTAGLTRIRSRDPRQNPPAPETQGNQSPQDFTAARDEADYGVFLGVIPPSPQETVLAEF